MAWLSSPPDSVVGRMGSDGVDGIDRSVQGTAKWNEMAVRQSFKGGMMCLGDVDSWHGVSVARGCG